MTTLLQANEAMLQRAEAVWLSTGLPLVNGRPTVTFDNEDYEPPDNTAWARFSIRHNASTQETFGAVGSRRFQRSGSAFFQIFTPEKTGAKLSKELSDVVLQGFEGTRIAGTTIRFNNVIPREVGPFGRWYQINVEINFVYDETK